MTQAAPASRWVLAEKPPRRCCPQLPCGGVWRPPDARASTPPCVGVLAVLPFLNRRLEVVDRLRQVGDKRLRHRMREELGLERLGKGTHRRRSHLSTR